MPSGGGGGYNSVTSSEPWEGQVKYLRPLFKTALYGSTGASRNPDFDDSKAVSATNSRYETPSAEDMGFYGDFFSTDPEAPGALDYYGNEDYLWRSPKRITTELASNPDSSTIGAPTVARFTQPELDAQSLATALATARTGTNYDTSLLGRSDTALEDIIRGTKGISKTTIETPTISSPGSISGANINYSPAMQAASANYNPAMQAATFDYNYWNDLGEMAGGEGGNPYLDDMVTAATRNLKNRYTNEIVPYLNSTAEEAGAGGSGAWADLRSQESQNYLNSIADVEANLRGNAFNSQLQAQLAALGLGGEFAGKAAGYTQEANRLNTELGLQKALANAGYTQEANQINTQLGLQKATTEAGYEQEAGMQNVANSLQQYLAQAGMEADINKQNALLGTSVDTQNIANIMQGVTQAPDINAAGYNDIGALSATGAEQRTYNQDIINAYIQRMEQMKLEPWNRLSLLSQLIGGNFGGTVTQTAQNG